MADMDLVIDQDADQLRQRISTGQLNPTAFRDLLAAVPRGERDGWLDRVLGIDSLPEDGPDLPRGCVPYLPCSVETVMHVVELANVQPTDVFVDVGSGIGRATALVHFLTGAGATGIEIQSALVRASRDLSARMNAPRITVVEGDAALITRYMMVASVFFLYCPFSGERLDRVLCDLEMISQTRQIRVCSVDLPLPYRPWLVPMAHIDGLAIHQSVW